MRAGSSIVDLKPFDPLMAGDEVFLYADPPHRPLFARNSPRPLIGATMEDIATRIPESVMPAEGLWMKTHFYQEGPILKSTTTCVTCGNVEVLKFEVDLRPIAHAAVEYHNALHRREKNARPAAIKQTEVGYDEELVEYEDVIAGCGWNPVCHAKKAVKKARKFVSKTAKKIARQVKKIGRSKLLKKIGRGMKNLVKKVGSHLGTFTGFDLVKNLVKGERIDKALMKNLKAAVKDVKSNAKYAQVVASVVPGLGTGVAAGIAGAAALAEGKRIDSALIAADKGALPGGPIAAAAFDTAVGLAKGKRIDKIALEVARNQLPSGARRAFDTGVALAHGRNLQAVMKASSGVKFPAFRMPKMGAKAAKAYAASSKIMSRLEQGASAKSALRNIRSSSSFLKKVRHAMKKVGGRKTVRSLRKNPAFARKVRNSMLVATAGRGVKRGQIRKAIRGERKSIKQIAKLVKASRSKNKRLANAAKKSLAVLSVVAKERARVAAITEANAGGRPGLFINKRGEILRGNFSRQVSSTAAKNALYSRGGVTTGHFMRLPAAAEAVARRTHPAPSRAVPRPPGARLPSQARARLANIARKAAAGDPRTRAKLASLKKIARKAKRARPTPRRAQPSPVAMAKLAELARRARGGDRQAQAQLAALKRMAAGRPRVSGNAVNEITREITSSERQREFLASALRAIDSPASDHEVTDLIGCCAGEPVGHAPTSSFNPNDLIGQGPLPEPPPQIDFVVNGPRHGEGVFGPPAMIGCPPMPVGVNPLAVGVNPLDVGSQYWSRPRHGSDAEGRAHMPDVADVIGRNLARNSAQYWARPQRNLDDVVGCPPAPVGMATSTPIPSVLVGSALMPL
jgi:hypothetical protein